eukprot:747895-Hanusia_phi.AAC.3
MPGIAYMYKKMNQHNQRPNRTTSTSSTSSRSSASSSGEISEGSLLSSCRTKHVLSNPCFLVTRANLVSEGSQQE